MLLGDFEDDFLAGRGEFDGLIELSSSLACRLANLLCLCIFIKILRSRKPSSLTTLASTRPALIFLTDDLDLVLEGVADLTVVN